MPYATKRLLLNVLRVEHQLQGMVMMMMMLMPMNLLQPLASPAE